MSSSSPVPQAPAPIDFETFYIGGAQVASTGDRRIEVIAPRNEQVVGSIPVATCADVDRAVLAARAAFDDGNWPGLAPAERATVLRRLADLLETRAAEITSLTVEENGAPIASAETVVASATFSLRNFAAIAESFDFVHERTSPISRSLVVREPVGVVAAIPAWNGPLTLGMQKLGAALAAGCTVVWKVPLENPLTSFLAASLLSEAGFPPGSVNVIAAEIAESEHLVTHPGIDKVSFTGSTPVGKRIAELCARDMRRVALELGGKSAAIVLEDADLSSVVPAIVGASVAFKQGEACTAQTRVLLPRSLYKAGVAAFAQHIGSLRVGDPFDRGTQIGPMISEKHRGRVEDYIAVGRREGATVETGGRRPAHLGRGWFVEPTLFANATNDMRIAREEIFGPVLTVIAHDGVDDAIAIANDSPYGLAGTVWTKDDKVAMRVARSVRTGTFCLNTYLIDPNTPFGGFKESGVGREMGREGFEEYLEYRSIAVSHSGIPA